MGRFPISGEGSAVIASSAKVTRGEKQSRYLPYFSLVILAELVVLTELVKNDVVLRGKAQNLVHPVIETYRGLFSQFADLRVGSDVTPLLSASVRAALARHSSNRYVLLLFADSCTSCNQETIADWIQAANQHSIPVILISKDTPEHISAFMDRHKVNGEAFPDAGGVIAERFRAQWLPRAYVVDPNGKLRYIQTSKLVEPAQAFKALSDSGGGKL